jgi:hypothetical protein
VPLALPALEALAVAALAIARPPSAAPRAWMGATALALLAACVLCEHLRSQGLALGGSTLVVLAVAAALQAPAVHRAGARRLTRAAVILPAAAGAAAAGTWLGPGSDFDALASLLRVRALLLLGVVVPADPMTGVLLSVRELQPLPPAGLWGPALFSWLIPWLAAVPLCLALASARRLREDVRGASDALGLLVAVTLGMGALTVLASRHRVLLAPMVAALVGVAVSALAGRAGAPAGRERVFGRLGLAALVPCLALAGFDAWRAAARAATRLDPGWAAALAWLRDHGRGAPVLAPWERGYELQHYAGCASYSDGMLESRVNRRHIVAAARALLAPTPGPLAAVCAESGVAFVVVPPTWSLYGVAMAAGDPLALKLAARERLAREDLDRVVVRMMLTGAPEPPFEPVFERGGYRLYRRAATASGSGAGRR